MTYINMASVKLYLKIQNTCTVLKLLACLVVIGGGIYEISIGPFWWILNSNNQEYFSRKL